MPELSINALVGAAPSPNRPDDVRTVQDLLTHVQPPLIANVVVTGAMDTVTLRAIREFQQRFMRNPDGKVSPEDRTLFHLNNGSVPQYLGCSAERRRAIDHDLLNAQNWLTHLNFRLANFGDVDMKQKVFNVFHINIGNLNHPVETNRYFDLRNKFVQLRQSLDQPFPLQCEPGIALELAWVDLNDPAGTMHFPSNYFAATLTERTEKIIHERAHTVLRALHGGMQGGGQVDFDSKPDDNNGFTYAEAINNAYCYGWLATALQPGYR